MNFRKLIGAALCAATVAAIPAAAQAQNYKPEYKLSIVVGTTFPWGQGAEIWSNLVRERTQGRINIKVSPARRWCKATRPANSPPSARA